MGLLIHALSCPLAESFQSAAQMQPHRLERDCALGAWSSTCHKKVTTFRLRSTTEESPPDVKASQEEEPINADKKIASVGEMLTMPWSDFQKSALRDNLAKYTVMIPLKNGEKKEQESQVFALWRTMLKEVPELAGYPIDFLQEMHDRQIMNNETLLEGTPGLLPYLEDYEFTSAGGVSGQIFGVAGLADGTRIETSVVTSIEVTLPQGFVRTSDGSAAYEVGRPKREEFSTTNRGTVVDETLAQGGRLLKNVNNAGALEPVSVEDGDGMLLRLGASTGILLAGATAVSMLSHHLTVNMFWV